MSTTSRRPAWSHLIDSSATDWRWQGDRLIHLRASEPEVDRNRTPLQRLQSWLVTNVYAPQNKSRSVRSALRRTLERLGPDDWGLCLGAGSTSYGSRIINIDVCDHPRIDIVTHGEPLPFRDDTLAAVISQEVLEHISDPFRTVAEVLRVLKPSGLFYCQLPFIIGYHPGPNDYWRFTREGIQQLFGDERWHVEEVAMTLGHGSALYRVGVEYCAVNAAVLSPGLYRPAKALSSLLLWPLTWSDAWTALSSQPDRINGGYLCVAKKVV